MNNDDLVNYDVFIDIDALFDTRLPILFGLSPDTMNKVLGDDTYYRRVKDSFGDIPSSVFNGFYDNRDKRVLLTAKPTEMFNLLGEYVTSTKLAMSNIGDTRDINVYVNIYPYELLGTEIDVILHILNNTIPSCNIIITDKSNMDLTPKWIEKNIGVIIKYDSIQWLDVVMSYGLIHRTPLLDVVMMGPHMITGDVDSKDVTSDMFNSMLESINTLIGYNFIKTSYYCIMK